jgi:hypothetical protein
LKATFVLAVCAMAAACAFGAYTPLIPSEEAVLPLGTFRIADTYVQYNDDLTRWDRSGSEGAYEHYARRATSIGWTRMPGWFSRPLRAEQANT